MELGLGNGIAWQCLITNYHSSLLWPVTLILTSRQRSWVTGTVDLLVTTPLLTVFGMTAPVVLGVAVPESVLVLLGQRWRGSAPSDAFSTGTCRKSRTAWSQSNIRKTLRLLRTTVKQEDSRVDLQKGGTRLTSKATWKLSFHFSWK